MGMGRRDVLGVLGGAATWPTAARAHQSVRPAVAAQSLMMLVLVVVSGKAAIAQSADAQERCTGDVMRLCSEFVPDADSIVVCLKAKRLQLTSSCLNALS